MINNRIYTSIIIRTLLLVGTCILLAFSLTFNPLVIINHAILIVVQVILLIRYLNKTNYEIAKVFDSIKDNDFSISIPSSPGTKSQKKLYKSISNLLLLLKKSQINNINKSQELYATIENIGTGLIWFTENGHVVLINKAAKEILSIDSLRTIDELNIIHKDFSDNLNEIQPSQQKVLKIHIGNEPLQIAIRASVIVQQDKRIKLISLQNIKTELDEAEMDSWQKLIRVLAHEIMNSIGPITTSTSAISKYFKNENIPVNPSRINQTIINNTIKGLQIIEERSIGLKAFVSNYRQLTNLPKPLFEYAELNKLITGILFLLKKELDGIDINVNIEPGNLKIRIDEKLISQVIINILLNAKHALQDINTPIIKISASVNSDNRCILKFSNNGPEISNEILDKIFVPFFTTKDDGSGIGLSFARQIMRLHGGSITVQSYPDKETIFALNF